MEERPVDPRGAYKVMVREPGYAKGHSLGFVEGIEEGKNLVETFYIEYSPGTLFYIVPSKGMGVQATFILDKDGQLLYTRYSSTPVPSVTRWTRIKELEGLIDEEAKWTYRGRLVGEEYKTKKDIEGIIRKLEKGKSVPFKVRFGLESKVVNLTLSDIKRAIEKERGIEISDEEIESQIREFPEEALEGENMFTLEDGIGWLSRERQEGKDRAGLAKILEELDIEDEE